MNSKLEEAMEKARADIVLALINAGLSKREILLVMEKIDRLIALPRKERCDGV